MSGYYYSSDEYGMVGPPCMKKDFELPPDEDDRKFIEVERGDSGAEKAYY